MRLSAIGAFVLVASHLLGCGAVEDNDGSSSSWMRNAEQPFPEWLSETGIFANVSTLAPASDVVVYEPPHPLYSNRAAKLRFAYLPPGETIDTSDPAQWRFPQGTVLVKTFTHQGVEGREGVVAIETRVMVRDETNWRYGVYRWSAAGDEARLLPTGWAELNLELFDDAGRVTLYQIPSHLDCKGCHETQPGEATLGLSPKNFDAELTNADVFSQAPVTVALPAANEVEARAMSYIMGNCAYCHHGKNQANDNASFSLLPDDLRANTVNRDTESSASGVGVRVIPGDPQGSAIYEAVVTSRQTDYDGDFKSMPPLGIVIPDDDASSILADWINSL